MVKHSSKKKLPFDRAKGYIMMWSHYRTNPHKHHTRVWFWAMLDFDDNIKLLSGGDYKSSIWSNIESRQRFEWLIRTINLDLCILDQYSSSIKLMHQLPYQTGFMNTINIHPNTFIHFMWLYMLINFEELASRNA